MKREVFFSLVILSNFLLMIAGSMLSDGARIESGITVEGIPEDGMIENPLNATASINEDDPSNWTIEWILDGEIIGEGSHIQRYIYPGIHNLTVKAESNEGESRSLSFILDPIPPPGWKEKVDQERNNLIFWFIFGSGGLIFAIAALWLWLGNDKGRQQGSNNKSQNISKKRR